MTNETLKNCPFCGGKASMVGGTRDSRREIRYYKCDQCEATGEKFEDKFSAVCEQEALNAWNNRTIDDKYKKAIEFIKKHSNLNVKDSELAFIEEPITALAISCRELLRELGEEKNET